MVSKYRHMCTQNDGLNETIFSFGRFQSGARRRPYPFFCLQFIVCDTAIVPDKHLKNKHCSGAYDYLLLVCTCVYFGVLGCLFVSIRGGVITPTAERLRRRGDPRRYSEYVCDAVTHFTLVLTKQHTRHITQDER